MNTRILLILFLFSTLSCSRNLFAGQKNKELNRRLLTLWHRQARSPIPSISLQHQPIIDGVPDQNEWKTSAGFAGFHSQNGMLTVARHGYIKFMCDSSYLYILAITQTPNDSPGGGLITREKKHDGAVYQDDSVELMFTTKKDKFIYHLIFNADNVVLDETIDKENRSNQNRSWNISGMRSASIVKSNWWYLEIAIPLELFGDETENIFFNAARNWGEYGFSLLNGKEKYFDVNNMICLYRTKEAVPSVRVEELGSPETGKWKAQGYYNNPTSEKYLLGISLFCPGAKESVVETIAVEPFSQNQFTFVKEIDDRQTQQLSITLFDPMKNNSIYAKEVKARITSFFGRRPVTAEFQIPEVGEAIIRHFPGYKKVTVQAHSLSRDIEVTCAINGGENGATSRQMLWKAGTLVVDLPTGAKEGKRTLDFIVVKDNLTISSAKDLVSFECKSMEWENNTLGRENILLPPFTPIIVDNNEIQTLFRKHEINNSALWNSFTAKQAEVLAEEMYFELEINGECMRPNNGMVRISSFDELKAYGYSIATTPNQIKFSAEFTMEYDGFYWSKFRLNNVEGQKVERLTLVIPLKNSMIPLFHVVSNTIRSNPAGKLPSGNGELWNGTQLHRATSLGALIIHPQTVPYVWLGGVERGICYFSDSSSGYVLDSKESAVRIVRDDEILRLEVDIINRSVQLKEGHTFEFGLQGTPIKPQNPELRNYTYDGHGQGIPGMKNVYYMSSMSLGYPYYWAKCPLGADFSLFKKLTETALTGKNASDLHEELKLFNRQHEKDIRNSWIGITEAEKYINWYSSVNTSAIKVMESVKYQPSLPAKYSDPRLALASDINAQYYRAEWWNPSPISYVNAYRTTLTPSLIDYLIYRYNQELENGMHGIYLDDSFLMPEIDSETVAVKDSDGNVHACFGILALRELIKRLAILQHLHNKNPRVLWLHMTNALLVPCFSFATATLCWEDQYGESPLPLRFSVDQILATDTGRQIGADATSLVGIVRKTTPEKDWPSLLKSLTRSYLALALPFGIKAWTTISPRNYDFLVIQNSLQVLSNFGAWQNNSVFISAIEDDGAIHSSDKEICIASYRCPDKTLIILSNLTDQPITTELAIKHRELGLSEKHIIWDLESNFLLDSGISIPPHDFRLVECSDKNKSKYRTEN